MRHTWAFESDLTFSEIVAVLDRDGPWIWTDRDNERWGDYRRTGVGDCTARVHEGETGHFGLDVKLWSDDTAQLDRMVETVLTTIFPLIKARNLRPGGDW